MIKNCIILFSFSVLLLLQFNANACADLAFYHQEDNDPLTEGFTLANAANTASAAVVGDMGYDSWQIDHTDIGPTFSSLYGTDPFTTVQKNSSVDDAWKMFFRSRVLETSQYPFNLFVGFGNGTRRFDLGLGLDSNGDTTAYLVESATLPSQTTGTTFTLTGAGNQYHLFELIYTSQLGTADLFIDGVERISDYDGHTSFMSVEGFCFISERQTGRRAMLIWRA